MSNNDQLLDQLFAVTPVDNTLQAQPEGDLTPLENADELLMIVDRSGSMRSILADAEGGVNSFIAEQQETGEANLTVYEFDSEVTELYSRVPIKQAPEYKLRPRSMTALFDAIGLALSTYRDVKTTGKRIAVIVTDGEENSSREWNEESTKELIAEFKEEGWEFVFLAASEKALRGGTRWGMDLDTSVQFSTEVADSSTVAYTAASSYTSSLRGGLNKESAIADMDQVIASSNAGVKKLSK